MHSLVMSPCSRDLILTSLVVFPIGTWFLCGELSTYYFKLNGHLTDQMAFGLPTLSVRLANVKCVTVLSVIFVLGYALQIVVP